MCTGIHIRVTSSDMWYSPTHTVHVLNTAISQYGHSLLTMLVYAGFSLQALLLVVPILPV